MRVLQISANWGLGGPGGVEKDIYYTLVNNGHECVIAYGRGSVPEDINSYKIGSKLNSYRHYAKATLFDDMGFASSKETKRLVSYIDDLKPDVIQLHNLLGYYINIEVLFNYLCCSGIPVVWTVHDCWLITGHCINFDRISCEKWKTCCHSCPLVRDYPKSLIDRSRRNYEKKKNILGKVKNITYVTPSIWLSNILKESFLSNQHIITIQNGIDLDMFRPKKSKLREMLKLEGKKVILFVASVWNDMKGLGIIKQLSRIVSSEYILVVIGEHSDNIVGDNVLSFRRTDDIEKLVEWYSTADVFVNPTLGDNFPTVNIEALACGTPVVTNMTGGSPEIVGDDCGRICKSRTPEELYQRIRECEKADISEEICRKRAKTFDRNITFNRYIELYARLIGH